MRKIATLILLTFFAVVEAANLTCEQERAKFGFPYYYCQCRENLSTFQFGLDTTISDTTWMEASIKQLQQGVAAYWFSNVPVHIDVFGMCSSTEPTITMVVGGNQMREKDVTEINKRLEEYGTMVESMSDIIKPKLRFYPMNGGTGRVIVYPYNHGPHSTCGDVLPIYNGMSYVSDHDHDVYALAPTSITSMFVQWKQVKDSACYMYITRGTCEGETVASFMFKDSTKVFFPDANLIKEAKETNDTLFFHFNHNGQVPGRILFKMNPKWEYYTVDTTFCEGKVYELIDTIITATTTYGPDSIWIVSDTVGIYTHNINVTPAPVVYDTMSVFPEKMNFLYRNTRFIREYGDYDILVTPAKQCATRYLLHVKKNERVGWQDVVEESKPQKMIINGKLYIYHDGQIINVLGNNIATK